MLIDVGTPFIRRDGRHRLDARVVVAAAPPGIRALLLRFVADSYQDDYFVPRTVALDLLGNFHKEGAPERIGTGLDVANDWLATADIPGPRNPITAKEVDDYYRQDARLLGDLPAGTARRPSDPHEDPAPGLRLPPAGQGPPLTTSHQALPPPGIDAHRRRILEA